jgi:hypothetical protein
MIHYVQTKEEKVAAKHTCGGGSSFYRKKVRGCPRCEELLAGAPPIPKTNGKGTPHMDQRTKNAMIRDRAAGMSQKQIRRKYGKSQSTVSRVLATVFPSRPRRKR